MDRKLRPLLAFLTLFCVGALLTPVAAQTLDLGTIFNTRRELSGRIWGHGNWIAFCVEEEDKDLNGDGDTNDTVLCVADLRTMNVQITGLAVNYGLSDSDTDWPVAISDDMIAVQVSEADQGGKDLNGNGSTNDDVLFLYNPTTHKSTNTGLVGKNPVFHNGKLYFGQPERQARRDLNGDGDLLDTVVCSYDPATQEWQSLGLEAAAGFRVEGDWVATKTSEAAQGGKDLNGDGDVQDTVAELYQISTKKIINTRLECSFGMALTPQLLAVAVDEKKQGAKDLNGDQDTNDVVCEVWDLSKGDDPTKALFNTGQDCTGGVCADGNLVGFVTSEAGQGNQDLNHDGDTQDEVGQAYILGSDKVINLAHDASGGMVAGGGKLAFVCSEMAQGDRDLNGDRDTDDDVLMVYDPVANRILNKQIAVDGDLVEGGGTLVWRTLESDQFNRDLNGDRDTDDSVVFVMDLKTTNWSCTRYAGAEYLCATDRGVGFAVSEADQGNRDLNGDGDTDDDVVHLARLRR